MSNNTMLINIPFQGFYESIPDGVINQGIEQCFTDHETGCNVDVDRLDTFYGGFNKFQSIFHKFTQLYIESFNELLSDYELEIELKYNSLESPKFYNFETDRLFCDITEKEAKKLFNIVTDNGNNFEHLAKTIESRFTSYDGFISHYSNNLDDWLEKPFKEWDCNELGTLLESFISQFVEDNDSDELNYLQYGSNYAYEDLDNYIIDLVYKWNEENDNLSEEEKKEEGV